MRQVTDMHDEGLLTSSGEESFMVIDLDCGHSTESPRRVTHTAPGEPYAGPGAIVATSLDPRSTRKAQAAQRLSDALSNPWSEQ